MTMTWMRHGHVGVSIVVTHADSGATYSVVVSIISRAGALEPHIPCSLGVSYALSGRLSTIRRVLSDISCNPTAHAEIRSNLFDEVKADMPEDPVPHLPREPIQTS